MAKCSYRYGRSFIFAPVRLRRQRSGVILFNLKVNLVWYEEYYSVKGYIGPDEQNDVLFRLFFFCPFIRMVIIPILRSFLSFHRCSGASRSLPISFNFFQFLRPLQPLHPHGPILHSSLFTLHSSLLCVFCDSVISMSTFWEQRTH